MKTLKKVWEGLESFKNKTILFSFILLLTAFFETLGIGVIYQVLRIITDVGFIENNSYLNFIKEYFYINDNQVIVIILISLLLIFIIKNTLIVIFVKWQQNFLNNFDIHISDRLFTYYISQPYEKYLLNNSSTYVRNLTAETSNFKGALQLLMVLISEGVIIISIGGFLLFFNPIISLIIFAIILLICSFYFVGPVNNFLKKISEKRLLFANKYTKFLIQGLASFREIRVYHSEDQARFDHYNNKKKVNDLYRHLVVVNAIPRHLFEVITFLLLGSYISYFALNDKNLLEIIPTIGIYLVAAYKIIPSSVKILNSINTFKFLSASINYIHQELKSAKKIENNIKDKSIIDNFKYLEFKDVSFRYLNTKKYVFKNISLKFKRGEIIGLKGESGSGKSTLINLMLGLLDPTSGKILVNSKNLNFIKNSWLKLVSYVPQNVFITDSNIFKNVAFGKKNSEINRSKLLTLLKKLNIFRDIKSKGLNRNLGERGTLFSGGQVQRIVFARALYKDPSVIFFDEATNGLDEKNEKNIFKLLLKLKDKKTLFISSHNQNLLNICDYILELKSGKIIKRIKQ
jgi:ABC-type multidrug transport system fused ATPase/permease subunit